MAHDQVHRPPRPVVGYAGDVPGYLSHAGQNPSADRALPTLAVLKME